MSDNYILFTDSGADIPPALLSEWGVGYQPLTFRFDHIDKEFSNDEMDIREFYRLMREGHIAKTSAVASAIFKDTFEAILAEGKDILYLAFSSGLSATCNNGRVAAEDAVAKFPDRKIVVVDSLAASAGQGLLLWLAVQKKREGASLEEVAQYLEDTKLHLCHWFTVDDLVYLKRGGRVSAAAALVGGMLQIKPVLHVDNEGHLIKMSTRRWRITMLQTSSTRQHPCSSATVTAARMPTDSQRWSCRRVDLSRRRLCSRAASSGRIPVPARWHCFTSAVSGNRNICRAVITGRVDS